MLRAGQRFGQYRIESVLGEGGMGIVYEATEVPKNRRVALKVVNPDLALDPDGNQGIEAARRLVREGKAAASLRHPNAVAVYDSGEIEGTPFIAMELARGRALGQFIGDKRVSVDQRIEWLWGMARGLAAAHRQGLVHRDVKPENVMVCDDGWVKLFDFGVAKPIADPRASVDLTVVTHTGIVVGTPLYMAPEQVLGDKLDVRSDQYSWATVAYELLSGGTHPVATTTERHLPVPFAILKGTPKNLREVEPMVPHRVAEVVMRAISKEPKNRYASMDEVVVALSAYLQRDPEEGTRSDASPSSEKTVAVASPLVFDDEGVRDTVTMQVETKLLKSSMMVVPTPPDGVTPPPPPRLPRERERDRTPAPAPVGAPAPRERDARHEPRVAPPRADPPTPTPVDPRYPPSPMSKPPVVRVSRPARPAERADEAVFGPISSGPVTTATASPRAPASVSPTLPFDATQPAGALTREAGLTTGSLLAKVEPEEVQEMKRRAELPSPLREWARRLVWIPVLLLAAVAGYLAYLLVSTH